MSLEIQFVRVLNLFVYLQQQNFLPTIKEHMFYIFISKAQNEAGNSVPPSLEVGIEAIAIRFISLGTCAGSLLKFKCPTRKLQEPVRLHFCIRWIKCYPPLEQLGPDVLQSNDYYFVVYVCDLCGLFSFISLFNPLQSDAVKDFQGQLISKAKEVDQLRVDLQNIEVF